MNILHITAHLGGGVGRAVSSLIQEETQNSHRIICLEAPEKSRFVDACCICGAEVWIMPEREMILNALSWSDIVILHWWHHPVMAGFLAHFPTVPVRAILWVHISGCNYPVLSPDFLLRAQRIFFTTPYSYENPEWTQEVREQIKQQSCVLYGCGKLSRPALKSKVCCEQYCIGYAGTFARSKIHPDFVKSCASIIRALPDVRFLLAGDAESWILEEAKELGIQKNIQFLGYLEDMNQFWSQIDVFGYPLNPQHFGATENVILEAMCAGVPVVCLEQATEKYILSHLDSGILAKDMQDYTTWMIRLQEDKPLRTTLALGAKKRICDVYNYEKLVEKFQREVAVTASLPKQILNFSDLLGETPADYLAYGLPQTLREQFNLLRRCQLSNREGDKIIQNFPYILRERSKSSIPHFAHTYPDNKFLRDLELRVLSYE